MVCAINKLDSNITGLAFAEEECLKELPVSPVWYGLEPNSYADFGGEISSVARSPIEPSRQNKKGTITDMDANGGFGHDWVNDPALRRLLQGFMFADIREKPTTQPMNAAANVLGAVTAADDKVATGATAITFNIAGFITKFSGFGVEANNVLHVVVSADTNDITVAASPGLTNEASPPATAKVEVVGYQFTSGTAGITKTGNLLSLTDSGNRLATLGLIVGEWIYIGGDAASNADSFVNSKGFARIKSIAAGEIQFDDVAFLSTALGATETSTGKTIRIFFGHALRNEKLPALIKRRSYQFERTLGSGPTDFQAEYIEGAIPNELTFNIPGQDKLNADFSYVAADNSYRSGESGDEVKTDGLTIVPALGADAFNTTSDVYRLKLYVQDATTSTPSALFAYLLEGNISVNNGVTPNKAVGVLGAIDASIGNFVVSGSFEVYFTTIAAARAVRQNADVAFNAIFAAENSGFIFDIPLIGLGGGRANVEKDQPVKISLEPQAAESAGGYTLMYNFFPYLPTVAMPQ